MKKNIKITIAALSVLLVMAIATTVASFSRAGEADNPTPLASTDDDDITEYDRNTNIDYIIINSHETPTSDEIAINGDISEYRIVEIGFGGKSSFGTMAENGDFEEFVINGNKSVSNQLNMVADKVKYQYYDAASIGETDEEKLRTVARADFIYISNVDGKADSKNDLGEELFNLLHTYAIGDYKPLIIDSPNASSGSGESGGGGGNGGSGSSEDSTLNTVITDYFSKQGIYYNTYEWDAAKSADKFLQGSIGETYYVGINSRTAQNAWKQLYEKPDDALTDDQKNDPLYLTRAGKVAKILVVSGDGSTGTLYGKLMVDSSNVSETLYYNDGKETNAFLPEGVLYVAGETFKKAYSTRYKYRPDYVDVSTAKIDEIGSVPLDGYDLVIFEDTCSNVKIGAAAYDRMVAAMKSKMYIIYDSSLSTATQTPPGGGGGNSGTGTGDANDSSDSKYKELYYLVATAEGVANYANVMPTNNSAVASMATSKSSSICKPIADLINNSSYRGIGGPKGSSTSFTVLEIQPCYPIDLSIATGKSSYYDEGSNMAPSGTTKDQIADGREYYDWELSEAKIAQALRMNYDDVKVEHMSIDEFAANRTDLLGKYDLIYIGGDRTALVDGAYIYTTVGESTTLRNFSPIKAGGVGYKDIDGYNGKYFYQMENYNARDLSDYNVKQLNEYVSAGMPLVVSKQLTQAYTIKDSTLDSKSNMYAFLSKNIAKDNVLEDFDQDAVVQDNLGGLGDTVTGSVTVFDDTTGGSLRTLYNGTTQRLILAVTSRPAQYNLYDKNTKLTTTKLDFKYDVNVSNATSKLYIDHNNNGAFEEAAVASGKDGKLSYDLSEYKGGLIYWKLEVALGNSKASTTGATYIKPNEKKQHVSVLQIVPDPNADMRNYGTQGNVSLLFCTICQRAYMPITYNAERAVYDQWYKQNTTMYATQDNQSPYGNDVFDYVCGKLYDGTENRNAYNGSIYMPTFAKDSSGHVNGVLQRTVDGKQIYVGKHEHNFGIYKFGGSTLYGDDFDDWDWNFADELSEMYDFHIDIMTTRQYEALDASIRETYGSYISDEGVVDETALTNARNAVIAAKSDLDKHVAGDYVTAEEAVRREIAVIRDEGVDLWGSKYYFTDEMQRLLDEKCYSDFFSCFGDANKEAQALRQNNYAMLNAYNEWTKQSDKKIDLTNEYMLALYAYNYLKSGGINWISQADGEDVPEDKRIPGSYSSVVIGAAENFGDDDINADSSVTLKAYADAGGQIIMFHECMGRLPDYKVASNITKSVIDVAGVNAYSDTQRQENVDFGGNSYYKYSTLRWNQVAKWNCNADYSKNGQVGTNVAVINNRCAINTYPFTLSDKLKVTGTHPVGFAINTDDLNVTPLYTLSTSTFENEYQKIYPASPNDGSDNSFIYRSGNFFYCGAGHSKVTGKSTNNNDERRLYINIICSSVANSSIMPEDPTIEVFDYGTTAEEADAGKGNVDIKETDDGYSYSIEEDVNYPNFTFRASCSEGATITSVNVYYKLDNTFESLTDETELKAALAFNNDKDKMIADASTKINKSTLLAIISKGEMADIDSDSCPALKLTADMFTPYEGKYTYIVIEVKDSAGGTSYQKIKIFKKPHLFDLT